VPCILTTCVCLPGVCEERPKDGVKANRAIDGTGTDDDVFVLVNILFYDYTVLIHLGLSIHLGMLMGLFPFLGALGLNVRSPLPRTSADQSSDVNIDSVAMPITSEAGGE